MAGDNIPPTVIATIVASIIASLVAFIVARFNTRNQERKALHDMISKMIDLAIQYPYFESERFCNNWPHVPNATEEEIARYGNFCCFVFNVLERVCEYGGVKDYAGRLHIRNILHVEEIIWLHRKWWDADNNNRQGYSIDFQRFVTQTLKSLRAQEMAA